ncbi:hypothetical protein BpHYR1_019983 [Brachionus plicatilis]|uniref:Uncharacterized protein n=1 Tax=Brachionus plicatilis TaxID=10195 RepID=A0A3M7SC18_BRAPC|nr:hypothetical protein BpHYR1_019983 [Brachionus plicatilis]
MTMNHCQLNYIDVEVALKFDASSLKVGLSKRRIFFYEGILIEVFQEGSTDKYRFNYWISTSILLPIL